MEQSSLTALGGELRSRRRARGLNRATLAQAAGTRPVIIGRWERGEGVPTPAQVRVLADVLEHSSQPFAAGTARVALVPTSDPPVVSVIHWPLVQNWRGSRLVRCGTARSISAWLPAAMSALAAPSVMASGQL